MSFCDSSTHALTSERNTTERGSLAWRVEEVFRRAGLLLNSEQVAAFVLYAELLHEWGQKINLSAILQPGEVVVKHFLDSALVLSHAPVASGMVVGDIGSGAGFPGVPMAILRPDIRTVLFEPVAKKAAFLHTLMAKLKLQGVSVVSLRLEPRRIPEEWAGVLDGVVSRYTASLTRLAACARTLLRPGGWLVAHKYDDEDEKNALLRLPKTHGATRVEWRPDSRAEGRRCFACVWF